MTNFNNRILQTSTLLLTFSFISSVSAQTLTNTETTSLPETQTCEAPPSCEVLGYTKTASDCANKVTLKCPLDEKKLYCADAKLSGVCSSGYSEIEKIIPYCTGDNARLIYDTANPNCAKCQKCGSTAHFNQISGCCPDVYYTQDVDGCQNTGGYGSTTKYNFQDSSGCWTCSKCRNQYTLNSDGLCVDPSIISGGACSSGYAKYEDIFPYCTGSSETTKIVEHSTLKGCYTCKKCSTGYYFNNKCSGIGDSSDGNGCKRCTSCSITSVDDSPVDGWCR